MPFGLENISLTSVRVGGSLLLKVSGTGIAMPLAFKLIAGGSTSYKIFSPNFSNSYMI